mmetsp:Transcript_22293/g.31176  ORF Transcript_22293/g.31176 Transcript_22293/m.31176 type:complete len:89 (-) Transcript_22293:679-945(-)
MTMNLLLCLLNDYPTTTTTTTTTVALPSVLFFSFYTSSCRDFIENRDLSGRSLFGSNTLGVKSRWQFQMWILFVTNNDGFSALSMVKK